MVAFRLTPGSRKAGNWNLTDGKSNLSANPVDGVLIDVGTGFSQINGFGSGSASGRGSGLGSGRLCSYLDSSGLFSGSGSGFESPNVIVGKPLGNINPFAH